MTKDEYYGSTKGMPLDTLYTRLKKSQDAVDELSLEAQRRNSFTEEEKLADRLHRLLHFAVDCDFYSSDWPHPTGCRVRFHTLAQDCINLNNMQTFGQPEGIRTYYPLRQLVRYLEIARFGEESL